MRLNIILNRFIINKLNILFRNNGIITNFVKEERRLQKLDETNTIVESKVYGTNVENTTFQIMIKKYGQDFIHLTIHLAPGYLGIGKKDSGIIHIVKDIYKSILLGNKKYLMYSVYMIEKVPGKPHSLHFSIKQHYSTTYNDEIIDKHDEEVKKEIDVITTVLNKLFNEDDKEHYIGHPSEIETNKNTNNILRNMNKRTSYIKRKNVGTYTTNKGGRRITIKRKM
jgi:hypothetical protein